MMKRFQRISALCIFSGLAAGEVAALDLHWTGKGATNTHGNRVWGDAANWSLVAPGTDVEQTPAPRGASLDNSSEFDNIFLYGGTMYLSSSSTTARHQRIQNLTVVSGTNALAGRYSTNGPDLRIDGDFLIKSDARLFLGAYSPNVVHFYGAFTAEENSILGNSGSLSDGGYWDLSHATEINLQGAKLQQMTNNWSFGPQVWNFGTAVITLSNMNTFELTQNVVAMANSSVGSERNSRGALYLQLNNQITGAGGIIKTGDATLELQSAMNDYSGGTQINAGVLRISGGNAIGDLSAVSLANHMGSANGGSVKASLVLQDHETIGSLAGGGTQGGNVILNGYTLTLGANNSSTTYAGSIGGVATGSVQEARTLQGEPLAYAPYLAEGEIYAPTPSEGAGNLVKVGTGNLMLSGTSFYTGETVLQQGSLTVVGSVLAHQASALGSSDTAIVLGNTSTANAPDVNSALLTLNLRNSVSSNDAHMLFERDITTANLGNYYVGRVRIGLDAVSSSDRTSAEISGNITYHSTRLNQVQILFSKNEGQELQVSGKISGGAMSLLINGSNTGLGLVHLSNAQNDYSMLTKVVRGALRVSGNVGDVGTVSAIGKAELHLGFDGAPVSITNAQGHLVTPTVYFDTVGQFDRHITLGAVANSNGNNGVANGFRIGSELSAGEYEIRGNVKSNSIAADYTNLTLSSEEGGVLHISGVIEDNTHATQVTRVSINQFYHHESLNNQSLAGQAYGEQSLGRVKLSGANTYEGHTQVHAGELQVSNTTGSATGFGNLYVASGATLLGSGTVYGKDRIELQTGSSLWVGDNDLHAGQLHLGNQQVLTALQIDIQSDLHFDLFGAGLTADWNDVSYTAYTGNDQLNLWSNGEIDLHDSSVFVYAADTTDWQIGQSWKLMQWSPTSQVDWSTLVFETSELGGFVLDYQATADGLYVTTSALVPEPSRALLLGMAAFAILGRRNRR